MPEPVLTPGIVNEILSKLDPADQAFEKDAINWGDLSCVEIKTQIVVTIEEVAPDSYGLRRVVEKELEKRGFKDVLVNMEW